MNRKINKLLTLAGVAVLGSCGSQDRHDAKFLDAQGAGVFYTQDFQLNRGQLTPVECIPLYLREYTVNDLGESCGNILEGQAYTINNVFLWANSGCQLDESQSTRWISKKSPTTLGTLQMMCTFFGSKVDINNSIKVLAAFSDSLDAVVPANRKVSFLLKANGRSRPVTHALDGSIDATSNIIHSPKSEKPSTLMLELKCGYPGFIESIGAGNAGGQYSDVSRGRFSVPFAESRTNDLNDAGFSLATNPIDSDLPCPRVKVPKKQRGPDPALGLTYIERYPSLLVRWPDIFGDLVIEEWQEVKADRIEAIFSGVGSEIGINSLSFTTLSYN